MKFYFLIVLSFSSFLLGAQIHKIDSLIQNIDNDQLYGTCHYAWFLEMKSIAGDSLIKIGNPAINNLIDLLDNKEKGIIAHYILVNISKIPYMQSSSFEHFERDTLLDYYYAGLTFHEKNGHFYTSDSALFKNKNKWIKGNFIDSLYINYDSLFINNKSPEIQEIK
jgi:hypothetical protein